MSEVALAFNKNVHFDIMRNNLTELRSHHHELSKLEQTGCINMETELYAIKLSLKFKFGCNTCDFKTNDSKQAAYHRYGFSGHSMSGPEGWFCTCGYSTKNPGDANDHSWYGHHIFRMDERLTKKSGEFPNWEYQKLYDYLCTFTQVDSDQKIELSQRYLGIILRAVGGWTK